MVKSTTSQPTGYVIRVSVSKAKSLVNLVTILKKIVSQTSSLLVIINQWMTSLTGHCVMASVCVLHVCVHVCVGKLFSKQTRSFASLNLLQNLPSVLS